jgi:hypothetical protein
MKHERLPFNPQRAITQEDRLQFAVRFAQMDLDTLRAGDWLNLREDFLGFLMMPMHLTHAQPYSTKLVTSIVSPEASPEIFQPLISLGMVGIIPEECPSAEAFSEDDFRALQADVRDWFSSLTHPLSTGWLPPAIPMQARVALTEGALQVHAPVRDLFLWHLFLLVLQEPLDRIRRCPECGTIFYRVKKQAYCSRKCGNRVTQRRWRERQEASVPATE